MFERSMTCNAHDIIKNHIDKQDKNHLTAVDATVGNGLDLLFLCSLESVTHVVGFDIQEQAIRESQSRIQHSHKDIKLILDSHHHMQNYVNEIDIAMFNLGYLPNGDKKIVTDSDTSLLAIQKAMTLLKKGGIITIMTYPGHEEGYKENKNINEYLSHFHEKGISVFNLSLINTQALCPILYVIIKCNNK